MLRPLAVGKNITDPRVLLRVLIVGALLMLAVVGTSLAADTARAEPPMRLPDQVTDPADVLSSSDRTRVQHAVEGLYRDWKRAIKRSLDWEDNEDEDLDF
mgnify:CR=1 FL=1